MCSRTAKNAFKNLLYAEVMRILDGYSDPQDICDLLDPKDSKKVIPIIEKLITNRDRFNAYKVAQKQFENERNEIARIARLEECTRESNNLLLRLSRESDSDKWATLLFMTCDEQKAEKDRIAAVEFKEAERARKECALEADKLFNKIYEGFVDDEMSSMLFD
jgi:F0F1-type ATP synthase beta subunit